MGAAPDDKPGADPGASHSQRLDKWLWYARVVKSRTLAATLIGEGKFRINGERVDKPSVTVKPGDVVMSTAQRNVRIVRVAAIGKRRGPATEAQGLFQDVTPAAPPPEARAPLAASRDLGSGRPTKKERRLTDKLRGR